VSCRGLVWVQATRKEKKKSLTRGHVKDIGSAEDIQSYEGQGTKRLCPGSGKYKYIPCKKGCAKDIISPVGCNSLVTVREVPLRLPGISIST
jgi:hypothetical protein